MPWRTELLITGGVRDVANSFKILWGTLSGPTALVSLILLSHVCTSSTSTINKVRYCIGIGRKSRFFHTPAFDTLICVRYPKPPNSINSTILFTYFIVTHRNAR